MLKKHFFRNIEDVIYEPNSSFIGIGSTPLQFEGVSGGIGSLTSPVFVVYHDETVSYTHLRAHET